MAAFVSLETLGQWAWLHDGRHLRMITGLVEATACDTVLPEKQPEPVLHFMAYLDVSSFPERYHNEQYEKPCAFWEGSTGT